MVKEKLFVGMTAVNTLQYRIKPSYIINSCQEIKVYEGEHEMEIKEIDTLCKESDSGQIILSKPMEITKKHTVFFPNYGKMKVIPTQIFDTELFIEKYTYDGDDLGATIIGDKTLFKVWAPTASNVKVNLYSKGSGDIAFFVADMEKAKQGIWQLELYNAPHKTYYTYTVTTAEGTQECVDIYAKAVGVNGNRGMVVDLAMTNPKNFNKDKFVQTIDKYTEAIIWEIHTRDFSNKIAKSKYKGKYLAFTEKGLKNRNRISIGVDYIKRLGVTHIQLLPISDYATVDERFTFKQFNWGYDPKNYNAPEGSYSIDADNGEVRIIEVKNMVQALHRQGLGIVLDVVYNHTYEKNSSFNKIVPYYYYRYTSWGEFSDGSGCGNETASERKMFGKFMMDSVFYWAKEYHIDGFRFDLMALHDIDTMQKIEQKLHIINPRAIIYGEGWTGGVTALSENKQASKDNIHRIKATNGSIGSIAVFNDIIRDSLNGSIFHKTSKGYISGNCSQRIVNGIRFGITGGKEGEGWIGVENGMVINYLSAHDNRTLWDKIGFSCASDSEEERCKMNKLGVAIVMLSKGIPFMQAGEEMLRTKKGEENSYNLDDEINNLDWESISKKNFQYKMMLFYKDWIAFRKANPILTADSGVKITTQLLAYNALVVDYEGNGQKLKALINPTKHEIGYYLSGQWYVHTIDTSVCLMPIKKITGPIKIGKQEIIVLKSCS